MASGEAVMCACFPGRVDPGVSADGHSKATGGGALGGKRVLLWTCIDESKQWRAWTRASSGIWTMLWSAQRTASMVHCRMMDLLPALYY